jgi:hypothetical protein
MSDSLFSFVLKACTSFQRHSVEYLVIGGTAVPFYGYYRQSTGIDGTKLDKHDIDGLRLFHLMI